MTLVEMVDLLTLFAVSSHPFTYSCSWTFWSIIIIVFRSDKENYVTDLTEDLEMISVQRIFDLSTEP